MNPVRITDRLAGKVAAVFGGGSQHGVGVGQAAAIAYAAAGADVAVIDYSAANLERTVRQIKGAAGVVADITDEEAVRAAIDRVIDSFGTIDILHNNVGVPVAGSFTSFNMADWMRGLSLNCVGAACTMRAAMPYLLNSRGVITNISSIASIRHTGIDYSIYNASKAALDQLTVAVALEYAERGVRANAILPGLLDTEMGRSLQPIQEVKERDRRSPTGRQGTVWDVANAAVFLASDEARYINAHLLVVDGGLSRRI